MKRLRPLCLKHTWSIVTQTILFIYELIIGRHEHQGQVQFLLEQLG